MPYQPSKGGTLLIPSGPASDPDKLHLYAILTDASNDPCHLLVNFTTIKGGVFYDPTCIVKAGEHAFIKQDSYVEYRRATIMHSAHIVKCVEGWTFKPQDTLSQALIDRICDGVEDSKFTPRGMKQYFGENS